MNPAMRVAFEDAGLLPPKRPPSEKEVMVCWKKVQHKTIESALAQAHQLAVHMFQEFVFVYRCRVCDGFHITKDHMGSDIVACTTWRIA